MGWAVLLRFLVQNLYEEALLSPLPKAGLGSNFTHPWVGQAERLACRKRPPTQFPGRSPDPLYRQRKEKPGCLAGQGARSRRALPL